MTRSAARILDEYLVAAARTGDRKALAVALAVPAGTVKTRLMHARRKLHDALKGEE